MSERHMRKSGARHAGGIFIAALLLAAAGLMTAPAALAATVVNCNAKIIQDAIDTADPTVPVTVVVKGVCPEIIEVDRDDVTIQGHKTGGTIMGRIRVTANRVLIDDMIVDGSANTTRLHGVRFENGASGTVRNSIIRNHTRSGLSLVRNAAVIIEGNNIHDNNNWGVSISQSSSALLRGTAENTQTITSNSDSGSFGNAVGVFNGSIGRLNGGNVIEATGAAPAIGVFTVSEMRAHEGPNTILSSFGAGTKRAISAGRNSVVSLRWFNVTGRVDINTGSHIEIRKRLSFEPDPGNPANLEAVITGDIRLLGDAHVSFPSPFTAENGSSNQGSATVNGRLICFGDRGHVASFGTGSGQTIQDVFPSQADREASQCNDFNGNVVLPVVGP